jgi:predicted dehydrogenase
MSSIIIPNRRSFLKTASAAGVVSAISAPSISLGQGTPDNRKLKVGLVGCGGRGSGAASDAMTADSNVELWAAGDVFQSSIDGSLRNLQNQFKDRVNVPDARKFVGMDAYQKVLESGVDVVILATPPGFRPLHFQAAVEAGKHIFCEKPVAVDSTGVRMVLEAARKAKEKGLSVVSGFCWRKSASRVAAIQRILDGAIGDIIHYYATYYTGPVKPMALPAQRKPEWSDVEWQVRNWYNFSWLSGDGYVEQAIHSVDKVGWAFGDKDPVSCMANGGRQVPFEGAEGYNIYDHFSCVYDYGDGRHATISSRQIPNCDNENADYIHGTKGTCVISGDRVMITGENRWRFNKEEDNNMYVNEHVEMYQALRKGTPVYDGDWMSHSTFLGLMGRMAAYTGKRLTWEQIANSKEDLAPDDLKWDASFTPTPMPRPGITKVV